MSAPNLVHVLSMLARAYTSRFEAIGASYTDLKITVFRLRHGRQNTGTNARCTVQTHVLPAAVPECACIGPNGPASNSMQLCGPKPPHKQSRLGSHPPDKPRTYALRGRCPPCAMRMRSGTRDPTCAHIP
eukprot:4185114-Prymnesium_polylepis.1